MNDQYEELCDAVKPTETELRIHAHEQAKKIDELVQQNYDLTRDLATQARTLQRAEEHKDDLRLALRVMAELGGVSL